MFSEPQTQTHTETSYLQGSQEPFNVPFRIAAFLHQSLHPTYFHYFSLFPFFFFLVLTCIKLFWKESYTSLPLLFFLHQYTGSGKKKKKKKPYTKKKKKIHLISQPDEIMDQKVRNL